MFAVFWMPYSFFWLISQHLNFIYKHFKTLCSILIGGVSRKNNQDEIVGVFINPPQLHSYCTARQNVANSADC
jgi:hypothetical protein